MAKDREKAPKRPTIEIDIVCPKCAACLHVKAFKRRISEPVTPEYQVTAEVALGVQQELPGMEKPPKAKAETAATGSASKKKQRRSAASS